MSRLASFLAFFGIGLLLVAAIHYYLWARLVRDLSLPAPWHRMLTYVLIALAVSVPATMILGRVLPREIAQFWLRPSFVWLGVLWLLLVSVAAVDLVKLITLGAQRLAGASFDPERRETLTKLFSYTAVVLGGGTTLFAIAQGYRFRVKNVEVILPRLPKELDGTTLVQITDVHIGPTLGRGFMEDVVRTVNSLRPDLVAITGDLVDGEVEKLGDAVAPLERLSSRFGTFFVTGNHEYYSGVHDWCAHLGQLGVRVLRNECVAIGENGSYFDLAGIDDYHAARFGEGHGADLRRAVADRDPKRALVLLAHQPRAVFEAQEHDVDLQLSGHTHGGQLWPFRFLVKLQQPVVSGLERFGNTLIYVSNGTGYWGPPMRLAAPAEVTKITLRTG